MSGLKFERFTDRLRLRPLTLGDAGATAGLMTPGISQWTGSWPGKVGADDVAARIVRANERMALGSGVDLAIERRSDLSLMGWIGIWRTHPERRLGTFGYWLGEAFHGQGYMTEAARVFLDAAWTWLDIDIIEAGAQPQNGPSLAILRGLGMRYIGERDEMASARDRLETCAYFQTERP